jgi:hypothetical protein
MRRQLAATFILTAVAALFACGGGATGIFEFCSPKGLKPGVSSRECKLPAVPQLFVGPGLSDRSSSALDRGWDAVATSWQVFIDGRKIDLRSFGTMPNRSFYEPSVGAPVFVREWNLLLVGPTPGDHTLRFVVFRAKDRQDVTYTFTVEGR